MGLAYLQHIAGPEDVVEHGLVGVHLHQGDMLVGSRVEDDFWAVGLENTLKFSPIDDVSNDLLPGNSREGRGELLSDDENAILSPAKQEQLAGLEDRNL